MPRRYRVFCLVVCLAGFAGSARGDLVVTIGNASIDQGGTGTVDVLLTSTAAPLSPDLVNGYSFQLQITNNGVDGTQLAYSTNQDFGYISNTSLSPPYLFLGDSSDAQPPPSPVGSPGQTAFPNDTFTGTDSTFSGNPVSVSTGTTYLLASLTVTTQTGSAPVAGDSFTISLVPGSGDGSLFSNPNTYFDNFDFSTGTETSATPFTSAFGTVTIRSAAVPEPSSIVSGLTALLVLAVVRRRKKFESKVGVC
jgi:hypothetical protein